MPKKSVACAPAAGTGGGDTVQRVLANAKGAMENFATPRAEAKDRVERIMRGEDPSEFWKAFAEERWNRIAAKG